MEYTLNKPDFYTKPTLPDRDKWLAALRSGKYPQGYNLLNFKGKYCCLGVLQEIQNIPTFPTETILSAKSPSFKALYLAGHFPSGVFVFIQCSKYTHDGKIYGLANCNDEGLTFNQIADIIEEIWENQ